jgi:hypothetical protein
LTPGARRGIAKSQLGPRVFVMSFINVITTTIITGTTQAQGRLMRDEQAEIERPYLPSTGLFVGQPGRFAGHLQEYRERMR